MTKARIKPKSPPAYHPKEERINVLSHAFGLLLSVVALVLLVVKGVDFEAFRPFFAYMLFGASLVLLYAASTFYHSTTHSKWRYILNIADHAAIYILIAGTYTPFALITLRSHGGLFIFYLIWGIALAGIILKVFFIGRFNLLSTLLYVAMGWLVIFYIRPLTETLSTAGLIWLFAGGFFYTTGAVFYAIDKIPYNHAIFHFFVLAGSFCHFVAIYFFVI